MRYRGIYGLQVIVGEFRKLDETLPIQTLACFLEVIQHGDGRPTITELAEKLNLASSSASRNVAALTKWHWQKRPGLGLVETVTDRMNLRKKNVVLTTSGQRLAEQIEAILSKRGANSRVQNYAEKGNSETQ